jgi:RNA polymerase sigma factor (sigma-70 family)
MLKTDDTNIMGSANRFQETSWTLVRQSCREKALCRLVSIYWKPLYFFVRRKGFDNEEAKDIVQGFLLTLLDRKALMKADPARGRFRTFLVGAIMNYIQNQERDQKRIKRGGGKKAFSLDLPCDEGAYSLQVASGETPERAIDRAWARNLWEQARSQLQGDPNHLEAFRLRLDGCSFATIEELIGLPQAAAKMAVSRLRIQLRDAVVDYLRMTVAGPGELEAELADFHALLC